MDPKPVWLRNHALGELWPAWLLRARRAADARQLARARWVWRDKSGRYLATLDASGRIEPLRPLPAASPALPPPFAASGLRPRQPPRTLPHHGLAERLQTLGLDAAAYGASTGLPLVAEPDWLALAGFDRYRRPLWLRREAARAWEAMRHAAAASDVMLEAISGWRSHAYQLGIFERKRARGLAVDEILAVNAAPGFSEHHSGDALDIGCPGEPPAEESFEATPAFAWLERHAADFGFRMSYPRDNPHGIVYEPWHWRYT